MGRADALRGPADPGGRRAGRGVRRRGACAGERHQILAEGAVVDRRAGAVPPGHDPAAGDPGACCRWPSGRSRPGDVFASAGSSTAGLRARAPADAHRRDADRGLPADHVRGRRHAALPRVERPADDVRRARGALAAAVPAVRAGPPPPAAQPGGLAQVLPARRVLVRVLPLRRRAALRLRRHRAALRHRRGGQRQHRQRLAAADRHGAARGRAAVQDRRGAVPLVDARRLPGRAHADHRLHGGVHQGRRVRCAAAGPLRRRSAGWTGTGSR